MWGLADNQGLVQLYTVDLVTGHASWEFDIAPAIGGYKGGLAFDALGDLYVMNGGSNSDFYKVNMATRTASLVRANALWYAGGGDFFTPQSVPLPGPLGLSIAGLAGAYLIRMRRAGAVKQDDLHPDRA